MPVLLLPVALLFAACGSEAPETEQALGGSFAPKEASSSKHPMRMLDPDSLRNMSNLLAGRIEPEDEAELDPQWIEHARLMNQTWNGIENRLIKMRQWTEEVQPAGDRADAPLLYPLGGPDLISAAQFFPDASSYLLIGLEAPGHLPSGEDFSASVLESDLKRLRKPFSSFEEHGYFVRSEIDKDLSGGSFDGILPILLICLVRAGQVPINLQYVTIDPETIAITPLPPTAESAKAVVIHYVPRDQHPGENPEARSETSGEAQTVKAKAVYYFAQDISNSGLFSDDPFSRLIQRQEALNVYMKSAEYLLHTDEFSTFRKLLLKKAHTLLQDDSGIPIRFLTSDTWDVRLFGQYKSVLAAYSHWLQDDLVAAFAKGKNVDPLDFNLGYSSNTDGGCLILGSRRTEPDGS